MLINTIKAFSNLLKVYDESAKLWQELLTALEDGIRNRTLVYPVRKTKKNLQGSDDGNNSDEDDELEEDEDDDAMFGVEKELRPLTVTSQDKTGSVVRLVFTRKILYY